ncbi:hypothetical protein [Citrobacter pasteurii]|nr:hypothetical protein [Citrobacter pasteurii]
MLFNYYSLAPFLFGQLGWVSGYRAATGTGSDYLCVHRLAM